MTQIAAEASYANQFADLQKKAPLPGCLGALRDDAFGCFDRLGFPTRRLESWRFTNIAPIAETNFVQPADRQDYTRNAFNAMGLPKLGGVEFVFLNGTYAPSLSTIDGLPDGLRVRSLGAVLDNDPDTVIPHLGRIARFEHQAFTALNTAFLRDGAVVVRSNKYKNG